MRIKPRISRPLGTMIAHGFPEKDVRVDLDLARRLGASCLEILPHWRSLPDPVGLSRVVEDFGFSIHSAHGCWGSQAIHARRVDLASTDEATRASSLDDIRRCIAWLEAAGGRHLVVHPGGLSNPEDTPRRTSALVRSLESLVPEAASAGVTVCVENMPPGVFPGSRMVDLAEIVDEVLHPSIALAIDTGHAYLVASPSSETLAASRRLRTTHVHDNHGRQDAHLPPGQGTIDWASWVEALDAIEYRGPIMLECIRQIRDNPDGLTPDFIDWIHSIAGIARDT